MRRAKKIDRSARSEPVIAAIDDKGVVTPLRGVSGVRLLFKDVMVFVKLTAGERSYITIIQRIEP